MASELRVNTIKASVGINTVTVSSGLDLNTIPIIEMVNTISTNYNIASGNNALTAGPLTIEAGVSVTVPSGSVWTIV